MSNDEKSGRAGTSDPYPRKYWWIVLVALPILIALIGVLPRVVPSKKTDTETSHRQSGNNNTMIQGNNNIVNKQTYVINMPAIEKEYAAVKGEPLVDGELKKQIEAAIALLNEGKAKESAAAFEKINQKVSLPSLQTNLGVAYEKAGNTKAAEKAFSNVLAQDPGYGPAQQNLDVITTSRGELVESEPNNEPDQANVLPLEKTVSAAITDKNDPDFFEIRSPAKHRDFIQVHLENKSTTLKPHLDLRDAKKSRLPGTYDGTPGADLDQSFVVLPDAKFFIGIGGMDSAGRYELTVTPMKKYDDFEPNENFQQAHLIEIGKEISGANIMDSADNDFYKFTTAGRAGTLKVHLENQSSTLRPALSVYDGKKSQKPGTYDGTPGANLDHSFAVPADATFYLQVKGMDTGGEYSLQTTQE